jgi:hypothetical protein
MESDSSTAEAIRNNNDHSSVRGVLFRSAVMTSRLLASWDQRLPQQRHTNRKFQKTGLSSALRLYMGIAG